MYLLALHLHEPRFTTPLNKQHYFFTLPSEKEINIVILEKPSRGDCHFFILLLFVCFILVIMLCLSILSFYGSMSVCEFVDLFVFEPFFHLCLSWCLKLVCLWLSVSMPLHPSTFLSTHPFAHLSAHLPVCPSVRPSVCRLTFLSSFKIFSLSILLAQYPGNTKKE